jgi:hypothetical protein
MHKAAREGFVMGTHGRDYLTGRIDDEGLALRVALALQEAQPYSSGIHRRIMAYYEAPARYPIRDMPYRHEAGEITEHLEGLSWYGRSMNTIKTIVQITLYRWGLREYVDGGDKKLAQRILDILYDSIGRREPTYA